MFLSGLVMIACGYLTRDTVALITNGTETVGTITSYDPHKCGGRKRRHICHDHTVLTEDLGAVTLRLDSQYEVGERIAVTYETGNKQNTYPGHKPTLGTLDGHQYGAIAMLALSSTMFVMGWHGAITGLGLRRAILKMIAYPLFLGLVLGTYVWVAAAIFGTNSVQVVQAVASSLHSAILPSSSQPLDFSRFGTLMLPVPCNRARSAEEAVRFEDSETCYYDLTTFRRLYPEFNNLSDTVLSDRLYSRAKP
jgi:hypothetical protein